MARSTLKDDFKRNDLPCSTEKTKALLLLCFFLKCSCRQGSSRGSSNGSSPLATWDLLYEVAREVERTIGFEQVWKGKKPNRTEINRFEPVFDLVVYFDSKPDRTENAQPYQICIE
ncbi:hypothetical protein NC651_024911 [Populus alba x Populus x berolinensis]|nr:hypothetical protein NC651_024911 [Populus alba x Populus x berolinensis]